MSVPSKSEIAFAPSVDGRGMRKGDAICISASAVSQWPDELPLRMSDRVQAALWRQSRADPTERRTRNRKGA